MSDYLKEILSRKNLINILILAILVLAVPLTINLVRQQQILFSKAATDSVQLVDNSCTTTQNNKKVLTCPTVTLNFVAPSETEVLSAEGLVKTAHAQETCNYSQQFSDDPNFSDGVHCFTGVCSGSPCGFNQNCGYDEATSTEIDCLTAGNTPTTGLNCSLNTDPNVIQTPTGYKWEGQCSRSCTNHAECKTSASDNNTYWCYGFTDGAKCMKLVSLSTGSGSTPTTPTTCAQGVCGACTKVTRCPGQSLQTYDICEDNLNQTSSNNTLCKNGATDFRCFSSQNSACTSNDAAHPGYAYSCEGCFGTSTATPTSPPATNPATGQTATLTITPSPATRSHQEWPPLTLKVQADSNLEWNVFYYNSGTCDKSACPTKDWTLIGSGKGNSSVTWPTANSIYVPIGIHTFGVFDKDNLKVLTTTNVDFNDAATSITVTPNPVIRTNGVWPDLTLQVQADPLLQWNAFYYNPGTCTKASCLKEGWTSVGSGVGNKTLSWPGSKFTNIPPSTHTFAVFDSINQNVLATYDVAFNQDSTTPPVNIVKVRYAENSADLTNPNLRREIAYIRGGVRQDITFSTSTAGTKFIYAQFVDDKNQTQNANPFPFQIDLVGPSPLVSGFACEVDIANSSDLLFKFTGVNFGATQGTGTVVLKDGGNLSFDSWTNTAVTARLSSPSVSATTLGTQYFAILTNSAGQKSPEQQCLVGITQISLGAKLFCRAQRDFDQANVELVLISDKDRNQKTSEKVTIDKEGNITNIKSKLRAGDNYIACIKAPLSVRRCSTIFTASSGTNNISIHLPIGDYNGDGAINNFDKSILQGQWGPMNSSKNCDVNRDKFCNSFEWSCMVHDFNASDQQTLPSFTALVATPTPTPTPTPTLTPTPTSSPTPTPTPDTSGI